jgi:hypothetical protein
VSVTIVFYCYKNVEFLQHSIITLLNQTESDWEVIVINDGFPYFPETEIPSDKQSQFRIVTLKQPIGFARACLVGFTMSRKSYCVFSRSWDFHATERLRDQAEHFAKSPVDFVFNVPRYFTEQGVQVSSDFDTLADSRFCLSETVVALVTQKALKRSAFCISSFMFRKTAFLCENTLALLGNDLRPKRFQSELILLRGLCTGGGICSKKSLVTINCREDTSVYEEDDWQAWVVV